MNVAVPLVDLAGLVAFTVAGLFLLRTSSHGESPTSQIAKYCLVAATAVYTFAMFSNVLEHIGLTAVLDAAEDYLEILFPAFFVYGGYALYARQRENELRSAQRVAVRSQEMMLGILDAAPAGIIVLDAAGRITFANETAKQTLDLTDVDGVVHTPGWSVRVAESPAAPDFAGLITSPHGHRGLPVVVEWPDGWRVELTVQTEQLGDEQGRLGGMVATFLPPSDSRSDGGDGSAAVTG